MKKGTIRSLALVLTLALVLGGVIGGTVAWLIASPEPVVNTFTYGDINLELTETDTNLDGDNNPNTNQYEMMPGQAIAKDPTITVKAGSEEMWLFVKLEKSANFDTFMEFTVEGNWAALDGADGVYYRHITADEVKDADMKIPVITGNTVTVKESVTKEQLNALNPEGQPATFPTLTVSAYGVQHAGNPTAADAWAKVTASNNPAPSEPPVNP